MPRIISEEITILLERSRFSDFSIRSALIKVQGEWLKIHYSMDQETWEEVGKVMGWERTKEKEK